MPLREKRRMRMQNRLVVSLMFILAGFVVAFITDGTLKLMALIPMFIGCIIYVRD